MASVFLSIVIFILTLFLLFVIFSFSTKKKRTEEMERKYNAIFDPLLLALTTEDERWKNAEPYRTVTNEEEGILALRDDERKMASLSWKDGKEVFAYSDYKGSVLRKENGLFLDVSLSSITFTLVISTKDYKPSSLIGRSLLSMAEGLKAFLDEIKE